MSTSELTTFFANLSLDEQFKDVDPNDRQAIIAQLQTDKDWLLSQVCAEQWHKEDVAEKKESPLPSKPKDTHALYVTQLPPDNDLSGVDEGTAQTIKDIIQQEDDWQQANMMAEKWHQEDTTSATSSTAALPNSEDSSESNDLSSKAKGKAPATAYSPSHEKKPEVVQYLDIEWNCSICFEPFIAQPNVEKFKDINLFGRPLDCGHTFCNDCLGKAIWSKVQEKEQCFPVKCPEPKCQLDISDNVAERALKHNEFKSWCEKRALHAVQYKIYCPVKQCGKIVEVDYQLLGNGTEAQCPYCNSVICTRCRVIYHRGYSCRDYQKLPDSERSPEDLQTLRLIDSNKWSRCPDCRAGVERTAGCPHISCRCGSHFCYHCGGKWNVKDYCCVNRCKPRN
ncbi:hypothetical protein BDF22DRAFT_668792 [Syncephalis plumigaleata]|nr:hypothetical protein BDF22DRAFT_668792 [Syncephalis plumigaleata]